METKRREAFFSRGYGVKWVNVKEDAKAELRIGPSVPCGNMYRDTPYSLCEAQEVQATRTSRERQGTSWRVAHEWRGSNWDSG